MKSLVCFLTTDLRVAVPGAKIRERAGLQATSRILVKNVQPVDSGSGL
jgi:hypothetical protein